VEGLDRSLVLDPHAQAAQVGVVTVGGERGDPVGPGGERGQHRGPRLAGLEQLGAVRSGVRDSAHADQAPGVERAAAGDAGHQAVLLGQRGKQARALLGHVSILRSLHDACERPVDVDQDRGATRVVGQGPQDLGHSFGRGRGHAA
jgi:hypothetical protein